jgi:chorismate dehydratase
LELHLVFGKIEYLNLLPFHVFMKRFLRSGQLKQSMHYYRGVPSAINKKFAQKKVDAAFISSIQAHTCTKPKLGIIAPREVRSVLVIPAQHSIQDSESATSNVLAKVLGVRGEVLIGDKALRYALTHDDYIDLAKLWYEKYKLPFVFALFCTNKETPLLTRIQKQFYHQATCIKIPQYLLQQASKKTNIPPKEILAYLELITYQFDTKSAKSYAKFINKAKRKFLSHKIRV